MGGFGEGCAFVDVNFGGGDSAAVDLFDLEGGVEIQGGGGLVEDGGIEAGVEEGSEEHVATDAGEAVEVGDAHGGIVSWVVGSEEEGFCAGGAGLWGLGLAGCVLLVTYPTIPFGLRPSGIMGHPCCKDFHGRNDADRYRLARVPDSIALPAHALSASPHRFDDSMCAAANLGT